MNNLQEQYNKLIKEYGEDRIVWIAAVGHSAYEQDSMPGEPVTACYLPTEDELYNIIPHNDLIDIRNIISLALDKNSSLLDMSFVNAFSQAVAFFSLSWQYLFQSRCF